MPLNHQRSSPIENLTRSRECCEGNSSNQLKPCRRRRTEGKQWNRSLTWAPWMVVLLGSLTAGDQFDCNEEDLFWDLNGNNMLDRDTEYLLFLQKLAPRPLFDNLKRFEELPSLLQDVFWQFADDSTGKVNVSDLFCRDILKAIKSRPSSINYERRRIQVASSAINAPTPITRQDWDMFRPSSFGDNEPADGTNGPTPIVGGIQIDFPTQPVTAQPPSTSSPVQPPSPVPSMVNNATPETTNPPLDTPFPTVASQPITNAPRPTPTRSPVVGAEITPRPTPNSQTTPAASNNNPPQAEDSQCVQNAEFADFNGDGEVDQEEFVILANLIANAQIASTFDELPTALQDKFKEWTQDNTRPLQVRSNIFRQPSDGTVSLSIICSEIVTILSSPQGIPSPTSPSPVSSPPGNTGSQTTSSSSPTTSSSGTAEFTSESPTTPSPLYSPVSSHPSSTTSNSLPVSVDVSNCLDAVSFADFDMDGELDESEFVAFVNTLRNALVAPTFNALSSELQDIFSELQTNPIAFADGNAEFIDFCQRSETAVADSGNRGSGFGLADLPGYMDVNGTTEPSTTPFMDPGSLIPVLPPSEEDSNDSDLRNTGQNSSLTIGLSVSLLVTAAVALAFGYWAHKRMLQKQQLYHVN